MFNSLYNAEIGGGYTLRRKVIINAADLRPLGGQIEVAAIIENGDELNHTTVTTEAAALAAFHSMVQQYAEPRLSLTRSAMFSMRRALLTMYGISVTMIWARPFFFSSMVARPRRVILPRPVA